MLSGYDIASMVEGEMNKGNQSLAARQGLNEEDPGFDAGDIVRYPVTVALDLIMTAADSLSFGTANIETTDATAFIDRNLGTTLTSFYENNQELVEFSSFAGGMFLPGMAALKYARTAGSPWKGQLIPNPYKRLQRFNKAQSITARQSLKKFGVESSQYREAKKQLRKGTLAEGAADAVIFETGFSLAMNEHAYLDENYDTADFMLGVGLGASAGVIKWAIQSKQLNKAAQEVMTGQKGKVNEFRPDLLAKDTPGDGVAANAASWKASWTINKEQLSTQVIDEIPEMQKDLLNGVVKQINGMSSGFANPKNLPKTKEGNEFILSGEMPYGMRFEVPEGEYLARMALDEPTAFRGVNEFRPVEFGANAELAQGTLFESLNAELRTIDAKVMKLMLSDTAERKAENMIRGSLPRGKKGVAQAIDQIAELKKAPEDLSITPPGIVIKDENLNGMLHTVIEIEDSTVLSKGITGAKNSIWLKAKLDEIKTPLILRAKDGYLDKKLIQRGELDKELNEAELLLDSAVDKAVATPADMRTAVAGSLLDEATHGVIIRQLGPDIIPSIEAHATMPASANPSIVDSIRKHISGTETIAYNYDANTMQADAGWIEVLHMVQNDAKARTLAARKDLTADNIYMMQAAYMQAVQNSDSLTHYVYKFDDVSFDNANLEDFKRALIEAKIQVIKELAPAYDKAGNQIAKGYTLDQIAFKVNMDRDDVQHLMAAKYNIDEVGLDNIRPMMYEGQNPEVILGRKPIAAIGHNRKYNQMAELRETQQLDKEDMLAIHKVLMSDQVDASRVDLVHKIYDNIINNEATEALRHHTPDMVANAYTPNFRFNSRDMVLRYLGVVGEIAVTKGQDLVHIANKNMDRFKDVTGAAFEKVARSQDKILEFSQLRRLIQANSDDVYRLADDGTIDVLNQIDKKTGQPIKAVWLDGTEEVKLSPEVHALAKVLFDEFHQLFEFKNVLRRLDGLPPLPDRGIWLPYEAVDEKYLAYVMDTTNPKNTKIITANTPDGFKAEVQKMRDKYRDSKNYEVITRDELETWNEIKSYSILNPLEHANPAMQKKGIAIHEASASPDSLEDMITGYQNLALSYSREFVKKGMADIIGDLSSATAIHNAKTIGSAKGTAKQFMGHDIAVSDVVQSTLLNTSLLNEKTTPIFSQANNATTLAINYALRKWQAAREAVWPKGQMSWDEYEKFGRELESRGVPVPWKDYREYLAARGDDKFADMAEGTVAKFNGIAATLNLRLMDMSHAILTVMSAPVVLSGLLAEQKYPMAEFIKTAKWMMKGGDEYKAVMQDAKDRGYVRALVSEMTELVQSLHVSESTFNKNGKKLVEWLSHPSDRSEEVTREFAYAMAYRIGKEYKGITDPSLLRSYANSFVIRSMGNYNSRQRPTMFQGALGGIIGLYQTFILSMGQNLFRYVENADWRAAGALMGAQTGMFGLESLPFFGEFNRYLGAYVADDGTDVMSTVYEWGGDNVGHSRSMAEFILFGTPSALFQSGFYTRGELQPRTPLYFDQGFKFTPPVVENMRQAFEFTGNLAGAIYQSATNSGASGDMGNAALQAMASQHIWRPGARMAEVAMGRAYDNKGELMTSFDRVSFPTITRLLASRPLKEEAIRRARFNGRYYDQIDRGYRQDYIRQIRRLSAEGNLDDPDAIAKLNEKYIDKGGSPQGWRDIMKRAMVEADTPVAERLMKDFKDNEGYVELLEGYR
jgi:hypothetical protein